jgi:hypothetical protein
MSGCGSAQSACSTSGRGAAAPPAPQFGRAAAAFSSKQRRRVKREALAVEAAAAINK